MQTSTIPVITSVSDIELEWKDKDGGTVTLSDMADKMDWEGGLGELMSYGGPTMFPPALRPLLELLATTTTLLEKAIDDLPDRETL